jgi:hypothetical protein
MLLFLSSFMIFHSAFAWASAWAMVLDENFKQVCTQANIIQHSFHKRGPHVAFNNVGLCWTNKLASFEQADLNSFELTIISWYWDVAYTYMHVYTPYLTCARTAEYEIISKYYNCM